MGEKKVRREYADVICNSREGVWDRPGEKKRPEKIISVDGQNRRWKY